MLSVWGSYYFCSHALFLRVLYTRCTSGILRYESTTIKAKQPYPKQRGEDQGMSSFRAKKGQAAKKWHAKAMLIDPRKTKLTIIGLETDYALLEQF